MSLDRSTDHEPRREADDWKAELRRRKAAVDLELEELHREAERKVDEFHRRLDESIRRSR